MAALCVCGVCTCRVQARRIQFALKSSRLQSIRRTSPTRQFCISVDYIPVHVRILYTYIHAALYCASYYCPHVLEGTSSAAVHLMQPFTARKKKIHRYTSKKEIKLLYEAQICILCCMYSYNNHSNIYKEIIFIIPIWHRYYFDQQKSKSFKHILFICIGIFIKNYRLSRRIFIKYLSHSLKLFI